MNKISIKFKIVPTGEILVREYVMSESHAMESLKREYAYTQIMILDIIDLEDKEIYNKIDELKTKEINKTIKQVKSTIKSFLKKPYGTNNKKREKIINCKYIDDIKIFLNNNYDKYFEGYLIENKIEVNTVLGNIYIIPTEEFFINAD